MTEEKIHKIKVFFFSSFSGSGTIKNGCKYFLNVSLVKSLRVTFFVKSSLIIFVFFRCWFFFSYFFLLSSKIRSVPFAEKLPFSLSILRVVSSSPRCPLSYISRNLPQILMDLHFLLLPSSSVHHKFNKRFLRSSNGENNFVLDFLSDYKIFMYVKEKRKLNMMIWKSVLKSAAIFLNRFFFSWCYFFGTFVTQSNKCLCGVYLPPRKFKYPFSSRFFM